MAAASGIYRQRLAGVARMLCADVEQPAAVALQLSRARADQSLARAGGVGYASASATASSSRARTSSGGYTKAYANIVAGSTRGGPCNRSSLLSVNSGSGLLNRRPLSSLTFKAGFCTNDPLGINKLAPYQMLQRRFVHGPNICGGFSNMAKEKLSAKLSSEEAEESASRLVLKLTEELLPEERDAFQRMLLDTVAKGLLDSWTNFGAAQKRIPYTGPFAEVFSEMFLKLQDYSIKGICICGANILLGFAVMGLNALLGDGDSSSGAGGYSPILKTGLLGMILGASKNPANPASPVSPSPATSHAPQISPVAPVSPSPATSHAPQISPVVIVMVARPFCIPAALLHALSRNTSQQIACSIHYDEDGRDGSEGDGRDGSEGGGRDGSEGGGRDGDGHDGHSGHK